MENRNISEEQIRGMLRSHSDITCYYDYSGIEYNGYSIQGIITGVLFQENKERIFTVQVTIENEPRILEFHEGLLLLPPKSRAENLRKLENSSNAVVRLVIKNEQFQVVKAILDIHFGPQKSDFCPKLIVFEQPNKRECTKKHDDTAELVLVVSSNLKEIISCYFLNRDHERCHSLLKRPLAPTVEVKREPIKGGAVHTRR